MVLDPRLRLLSIGRSLYRGQSPRSYLDPIARKHLLPLLTEVAEVAEPRSRTRSEAGTSLRFEARPILGPSGAVHAVLGCYVAEGEAADDPPLIGAWEWDAPALRTYWDRDLFAVYGFTGPDTARSHWEAPEWFSMLEQGGYPQMREVLARFQRASSEDLILHLFRIVRAEDGEISQLRLAGRPVLQADGTPRWFRGITARVDGYAFDAREQFTTQQFLDAALHLCPLPLAVVDLQDDRVYLTNPAWEASGVVLAGDHNFSYAVHPDDLAGLQEFLLTAPPAPSAAPVSATARFRKAAGWEELRVTALRLTVPATSANDLVDQAMVRLEPL